MRSYIDEVNELAQSLNTLLPMKEEDKIRLDKKIRLEFNYNSNHMEGNTLTYGETALLLIFGDTKGNHTIREYEEMKGHDVAYKLIVDLAAEKEHPLTESFIKNLNRIILKEPFWKEAITLDGQKTRRLIKIGDYKEYPNSVQLENGEIFHYASPQDTPILMGELVEWFRQEEEKKELPTVALAALLHYKFVRIHPFDDGNGRISRLLMNYVLLKNNLPPVIIKSADKKNYLRALNEADAGNFNGFIEYIAEQLIWSLEISIKAAKGETIDEPDDLEKEIALMEKEVDIISGENIKNKQLLRNIWDACLFPLLGKYFKKFSSFEKLFNQKRIQIYYYPRNQPILVSLDLLNQTFKKDSSQLETISMITVIYNFEDMKKIHFNINSNVRIYFHPSIYTISIDNKQIEKRYNQFISEQEMDNLINERGEDFLKKIKKQIEKTNS